jgi:uncharacterized YccA/Bax inhibitor family protein
VRSSNPVLTRLNPSSYQRGYAPPSSTGASYPSPVMPVATDRMTVDDVVVRTVGLLALTVASAAATWALVPLPNSVAVVWAAMLIGLVIGFIISFSRITNPVLLGVYAVVEGAFLGALSHIYEYAYSGIVVQAVLATLGIFFVMSLLYKSRVIRATPRFNRILFGCLAGASVVILGNLLLYALGVNTALNGNGPVAFLFAAFIVVIGALSFISDFDLIERAVAQGAPKQVAWTCAFGLLVGLIVVYIYVLRLLSIVRSN